MPANRLPHVFWILALLGFLDCSILGQGIYAVSRPTLMSPARGFFFGPVLARPIRPQVNQPMAAAKAPALRNSNRFIVDQTPLINGQQARLHANTKLWLKVRQGNAAAMFKLAKLFLETEDDPRKIQTGRRLLYMAAHRGFKPALNALRKKHSRRH